MVGVYGAVAACSGLAAALCGAAIFVDTQVKLSPGLTKPSAISMPFPFSASAFGPCPCLLLAPAAEAEDLVEAPEPVLQLAVQRGPGAAASQFGHKAS